MLVIKFNGKVVKEFDMHAPGWRENASDWLKEKGYSIDEDLNYGMKRIWKVSK